MTGTDARQLAHQLEARSDAELVDVLSARKVNPNSAIADAFDLADELLDPASLARAFVGLSATQADALATAVTENTAPEAAVRAALLERALLDDEGLPWNAVADAFRVAVRTGGGIDSTAAALAPASAASPEEDAVLAERAFTAVVSLADVLQSALATPLARIGAGQLGAADRRRLIEAGAVDDAEGAEQLVAIADRAGLLAVHDRIWLVTPEGMTWLHSTTASRWGHVAERLIASLPEGVQTKRGGWIPPRAWAGAYPFDPSWAGRAAESAALLERWALLDESGASPSWAHSAQQGGALDLDALTPLLPPEVDRVYLQNDLTAIAPGPLAPHLDMRMRTMARLESRAQASSYRFTAETLAHALTAGESAESLRAFLTEISLSGLPQPLSYEIERSATRHGSVQVGPDPDGRTRISSSDEALLRTIAVDQALRPLGLVFEGKSLASRSMPDTVFWMIADARYPVIAVDSAGKRRSLDRYRVHVETDSPREPISVFTGLISRIRAARNSDADAAWLGRELEQAVRARATIVIGVRLPDGTEREFTIEATGIGGGRLRGRDRLVDVERTLPISSITHISPV